MTLFIIVLAIFLVVWFSQSIKNKEDQLTYKKRTITNVQLQDELSKKNFKKVIDDLTALPLSDQLSGNSLIDAIESLYQKYDVPDRRTPEQKSKDRTKYLSEIAQNKTNRGYPEDDSKIPLIDKIWYYPWKAPLMNRLDLLYGIPNTTVEVNGVRYKYDFRGIPSNLYWTIPAQLIGDLEVLLTTRDLNSAGYNYSWDRKESHWQRADTKVKKYDKNKKKYPWLYK